MDYSMFEKRIIDNGEPGLAWLDNMQNYSRTNGEPDMKDIKVTGGNPCLEQSLESYELCCLVETFPNHHDSLKEFLETLECAFLYGKSVTLGEVHWEETNELMKRNRRIGTSMSGIVQFITNHGLGEMKRWCEEGYDHLENVDQSISEWLQIPESIKKTSVKPSGTLSLVAGATPGIHHPKSRYYIRRMRILKDSEVVVEFPVKIDEEDIRIESEVSIWEKTALTAFFQMNWADNQTSSTVTFDKEKEGHEIPRVLDYFQWVLKGVSFLPVSENEEPFPQMPYEKITKEDYKARIKYLKPLNLGGLKDKAIGEKFCTNDKCLL
jgi:ribonucleotide reductase alpha subunit